MTALIAGGAAFPLLYAIYFFFAVKWRMAKDRQARYQRRMAKARRIT